MIKELSGEGIVFGEIVDEYPDRAEIININVSISDINGILGLVIKEKEIIGVDSNSLCYVARKNILTKDNVRGWVNKAKELSRSDFQREVKFGHVDEMKCDHKEEIKKTTYACPKCGRKRIEKK